MPSACMVIGFPRPDFLDEPPKTSGGKKPLPQERRFRLPYLKAAFVNVITRDYIFTIIDLSKLIYNKTMKFVK